MIDKVQNINCVLLNNSSITNSKLSNTNINISSDLNIAKGEKGDRIELRLNDKYIQYKYPDTDWINLFSVDDLASDTFATVIELNKKANKIDLDTIEIKIENHLINHPKGFSGNYNDLTNKPTIPIVDVNKEYVDTQLNKKSNLHEHPYLSNNTIIPTKNSQLQNDSNYTTKSYVDKSISDASFGGGASDLSKYATKEELNTKANIAHEHTEYIKEHQDISHKADRSELHSHANKSIIDAVTSAKVKEWDSKSNFSGSYNDLTNKPTIPIIDVTKAYVDTELLKKSNTTHTHNELHSHSNKNAIDAITTIKINEWNNKSNFSGNYNDLTNKPNVATIEYVNNIVGSISSTLDDILGEVL